MKPLFKPSGKPHPDLLKHALGLSGVSTASNATDFKASVQGILRPMKALAGADTISLESRQDEGNASLRTYILSVPGKNTGNVQFSYGGIDSFTMKAALFWSYLPPSIERVIAAVDGVWRSSKWRVLYAYDCDDFALQNCTMSLGLEHWGLTRDQLHFVNRYGIVEEIDTRGNPGFMLNYDGLFWTVQWLNYWSKETQNRMLAEPPAKLPAGVEIHEIGGGAIRIRLGEKPGLLDDIGFHRLQLECRRTLPFRSPFAVHG